MSTQEVHYTEFVDAQICFENEEPEVKPIAGSKTNTYLADNFAYLLPTETGQRKIPMAIRFPSLTGHVSKFASQDNGGRPNYTLGIRIDEGTEEGRRLQEIFQAIHRVACYRIASKQKLSMQALKRFLGTEAEIDRSYQELVTSKVNPIARYPKNKETGQLLEGKSPTFRPKLLDHRTIFTNVLKEKIDWHMLEGTTVQIEKPLIMFQDIFSGTLATCIRFHVVSGVVTSIVERVDLGYENRTADKLLEENPEKYRESAEKLNEFMKAKASSSASTPTCLITPGPTQGPYQGRPPMPEGGYQQGGYQQGGYQQNPMGYPQDYQQQYAPQPYPPQQTMPAAAFPKPFHIPAAPGIADAGNGALQFMQNMMPPARQ